jgi:hypothetical protein
MKIDTLKYKILALLIMMSGTVVFGQSKSKFLDAAETAFEDKDYYSSLVYYSNVLEFDENETEVQYNYANSARLFDAYNLADSIFTKVVESDNNNDYPLATFYLAEMKQKKGNYKEALDMYRIYLSEHEGEDEYFTTKANKEIESCTWAASLQEYDEEHIKVERLSSQINTKYSEFGATDIGDTIIFSSLRFKEQSGRHSPDRLSSKLMIKEQIGESLLLDSEINNNRLSTAHSAFTEDQEMMFYTVCEYETANDIVCDLYFTMIKDLTNIMEGMPLPAHINVDSFTQTQPFVLGDTLFFVSDMTGGEGGLDLWQTTFDRQGNFTNPVNISDVNTAANEITPYYSRVSETLYFSSDGYTGLGGYDVYAALQKEDEYLEPENVGAPINSSYNDVYYHPIGDDEEEAYFSSNRTGTIYLDDNEEACCYDVFKAEIGVLDLQLNAQTFNEETMDSLFAATVRVIDLTTGKSSPIKINKTGIDHLFPLAKNREYQIIGEKSGFEADTILLNTKGIMSPEIIIRKLYLKPNTLHLDLFVFDEKTLEALNGSSIVIENLDDPDMPLIKASNFNSNDYKIPLLRHTKYRISVSKEGYESTSLLLDTSEATGDSMTKKVYLKKKENLNYFLPVTLYFDNDRPNKKTLKTTTTLTYTETYFPYVNRREYFKSRYAKSLIGEEKFIAEQDMDNFFTNYVNEGYNKMGIFLDALSGRLANGESLTLVIKGYASPVAGNEYNKSLSKRRISSIKNELRRYKLGMLAQYINNGSLGIREIPYGEDLAPKSISDSSRDTRRSVYSIDASRERRTEILKVESN